MKSIKDLMIKNKLPPQTETTLYVDCRTCGNEPDLGCTGCIKCLCGMIEQRGEQKSIILRSGTETQIEKDAVDVLNDIALDYTAIKAGRTEKQCAGCILSRESLESEKWVDLSLDNLDEIITRLDSVYVGCRWREECIIDAKNSFTQMRIGLENASKEAAKTAYKIVGA